MTKPEQELQNIPVQVYLSEDDYSMFEQLRRETRRSKSDMVRFLVSQEYDRLFKSKQSTYNQRPSAT